MSEFECVIIGIQASFNPILTGGGGGGQPCDSVCLPGHVTAEDLLTSLPSS